MAAAAADIEKFLIQWVSLRGSYRESFRVMPTIPVSADLCWDWKNTASSVLHFGHVLLDLGS